MLVEPDRLSSALSPSLPDACRHVGEGAKALLPLATRCRVALEAGHLVDAVDLHAELQRQRGRWDGAWVVLDATRDEVNELLDEVGERLQGLASAVARTTTRVLDGCDERVAAERKLRDLPDAPGIDTPLPDDAPSAETRPPESPLYGNEMLGLTLARSVRDLVTNGATPAQILSIARMSLFEETPDTLRRMVAAELASPVGVVLTHVGDDDEAFVFIDGDARRAASLALEHADAHQGEAPAPVDRYRGLTRNLATAAMRADVVDCSDECWAEVAAVFTRHMGVDGHAFLREQVPPVPPPRAAPPPAKPPPNGLTVDQAEAIRTAVDVLDDAGLTDEQLFVLADATIRGEGGATGSVVATPSLNTVLFHAVLEKECNGIIAVGETPAEARAHAVSIGYRHGDQEMVDGAAHAPMLSIFLSYDGPAGDDNAFRAASNILRLYEDDDLYDVFDRMYGRRIAAVKAAEAEPDGEPERRGDLMHRLYKATPEQVEAIERILNGDELARVAK